MCLLPRATLHSDSEHLLEPQISGGTEYPPSPYRARTLTSVSEAEALKPSLVWLW